MGLATAMSSNVPHEVWHLWTQTQRRQSRENLITCRADERALRHMSQLTDPSDNQLSDHSIGVDEDCYFGDCHYSKSDSEYPNFCDRKRDKSRSSKPAAGKSRLNKSRKPKTNAKKRSSMDELLDASTLYRDIHSLLGLSTSAQFSSSLTFPKMELEIDSNVHNHPVGDAMSQMAGLRLSNSLVKEQEEIWEQIKANPTSRDSKPPAMSHILQDTLESPLDRNNNQQPLENCFESTLKLNGKRVRIVTQSQVEAAYQRGEAIEITCIVCETRLLTTINMYPGMVYCPECGAVAPSDLYQATTKK